jgi:hypothetical protein
VELLELYLSPVNKTRFKVIATSSLGIKGDTQSKVPFRERRVDRRSTVLKILEANSFRSEDFQGNAEQDWMVQASLLTQNRRAFHPKRLVNIGQVLYKALFPSGTPVQTVLVQSLARAEEKSTQLHIQLQFAADDLQQIRLPDYPWELMHDDHGFLAQHQVTFSRHIAFDAVPPHLSPLEKVNVLLVSSTAFDNGFRQLLKQEQQAIHEALKKAEQEGHIHLDQLDHATIDTLRTYLTQHRGNKAPHVFHFDGHGFFGQRCKNELCRKIHKGAKVDSCKSCGTPLCEYQGYLLFEDKAGGANYVSAKELGALLQQASFSDNASQKRGIALVVMTACQSALSLFTSSIFNGVAQSLISHRIPAVVAMQYKVNVSSATAFAEQFYRSLGQRDSLALAVSQAREAMGVEGEQWYRPVLYLRWKDNEGGQLFAVPKAAASASIKQVSQAVSDQLAHAPQTLSSTEITRALENASRRTYYRKQAEIWLGDKNYRWNLALILVNKTLESESLDIYKIRLLQKEENQFRVNIYNCLNWLIDAFQAGKGQNTDKLKEYLIEHSLDPYEIALCILKYNAKQDFQNNIEVIDTINRYIDNLISRLKL